MDDYAAITEKCREFLKEPEGRTIWDWAMECMDLPGLAMHCPQHHYLFPAVLLTACAKKERKSEEELLPMLEEAKKRAKKVLGGFCGYYGNCGAAVGVGIFLSIYTNTTPLSEENWQWVNEATGRSLIRIASVEGPRCCKRNGFLAFEEAVEVIRERLSVHLEMPSEVKCHYFLQNKECKHGKCPYFKGKKYK